MQYCVFYTTNAKGKKKYLKKKQKKTPINWGVHHQIYIAEDGPILDGFLKICVDNSFNILVLSEEGD